MASFQTFFRTVVMLATLGIVAKAWYLYGPTCRRDEDDRLRVAEVASGSVERLLANAGQRRAGRRSAVPSVGRRRRRSCRRRADRTDSARSNHAAGTVERRRSAAGRRHAGGDRAVSPAGAVDCLAADSPPEPTRLPPTIGSPATPTDARLAATLERLAQLGMRDQELVAVGQSRRTDALQLQHRRGPIRRRYSRHFEAVADDAAGGRGAGGGRDRGLAAGTAVRERGAGSVRESIRFGAAQFYPCT